jgi:hypothetical protein
MEPEGSSIRNLRTLHTVVTRYPPDMAVLCPILILKAENCMLSSDKSPIQS